MKKTLWIFLVSMLAISTGYSQYSNGDDVYYNGNDDYNSAYNNADAYNNSYDQSNSYGQDNQYAPDYQTFYNQLSPYGDWVFYGSYGYVWVPNSTYAGFSPYLSGGHWNYTVYGWMWVSDYSWGWAPFHYGRWFYDVVYGWVWQPGYQWAPAWVMWGSYNNYYCWAPMGPGVNFYDYGNDGYYYNHRDHDGPHCGSAPYGGWNFVRHENVTNPHVNTVIVNNTVTNVTNNITVINQSGKYDGAGYYSGPRVEDVEHATGHTITRLNVTAVSKPGVTTVSNNQVSLYRPTINKVKAGTQSAPAVHTVAPVKTTGKQTGSINRANVNTANVKQVQNTNNFGRNTQPVQYGNTTIKSTPNVSANNYNTGNQVKQQNMGSTYQQQPVKSFNNVQTTPVQQQNVYRYNNSGNGNRFQPQIVQQPAKQNISNSYNYNSNNQVHTVQPVQNKSNQMQQHVSAPVQSKFTQQNQMQPVQNNYSGQHILQPAQNFNQSKSVNQQPAIRGGGAASFNSSGKMDKMGKR